MRPIKNILGVGLGLVAAWYALTALAGAAAPAAVTFTVDNQSDLIDANTGDGLCTPGSCSLRAAIMQANKMSGPLVTIIVPAGTYTLTRPPTVDDGDDSGDLNLSEPPSGNTVIAIVGANAATTVVDANQLDRVLSVAVMRTASLSGLTFRNGLAPSPQGGGGINNLGTLSLLDSTLSGNGAYSGGAVSNGGTLTITRSTLAQNSAEEYGGALNNTNKLTVTQSMLLTNTANLGGGANNVGLLTIIESTVGGNTVTDGGGGLFNNGTLWVVNSTVSSNRANGDGGGVFNGSKLTYLYNATIAMNEADHDQNNTGSGAGIINYDCSSCSSSTYLHNTLVAGNNVAGAPVYDDCRGTLGSYGGNRIGTSVNTVNCTVVTLIGSWDHLNGLSGLGALQNNGGRTWTQALKLGSNAIDQGDTNLGCIGPVGYLVTDQRGAARVGYCDIGAFEYQPPLLLPLIRR